jgi:hypothetical protein
MEISIKPEDIDVYVKNAILESTIGKEIKSGLEKALSELFTGYRNPIPELMKAHLQGIVSEYLEKEEIKSEIKESKQTDCDDIARLQELTKPKPRYKDAWFLSNNRPKCTKVHNLEGGYRFCDESDPNSLGCTMFETRDELIDSQIKYWEGLKSE